LGGTTGAVTASGTVSGLAASASNTTSLAIGLMGTHDGVQNGTAALTLVSNGAGIDSLGTTALTTQTIAATGTLYNYATVQLRHRQHGGAEPGKLRQPATSAIR
jgi:hypothetical protein